MSLNGNLTVPDGGYIYSNTSTGVINIGKDEQIVNINGIANITKPINSLNVNNLSVNNIIPINQNVNILGETINIGPFNGFPNVINIGNDLSVVNILGTSTYTFTNIVTQTVGSPILILNTDISNNLYGQFSGIQIDSISGPGYLITDETSTKFLVKAPLNTNMSYMATTDLSNNMTVIGKLNIGNTNDVESVLNNKVNNSTLANYYTATQIDNKKFLNTQTAQSMFVSITNQSNITTLNVINTSNLLGNVTAYSRLNVIGKTTLNDSLLVTGPIIGNSIASLSSFSVIGKSIFNGAVTMNSTLNIDNLVTNKLVFTGPVTMPSTLQVNGSITTNNNLSVANNINMGGALNVSGSTNIGGMVNVNNIMNVTGQMAVGNGLNVTGNVNISNNLRAIGTIISDKTISASQDVIAFGNITTYNKLSVKGNSYMNSNMSVIGSVTIGSDLAVLGNIRLNNINANNVNVNNINANNISTTGTINSIGSISTNSNLFVGGIIQTNNINCNNITTTSNMNIGGNINIGGTLQVNSITSNSDITGNRNLNISGNAKINGNLTLNGNITGVNSMYTNSLGVGGINNVEDAINSKIDQSALASYLTKTEASETYMPLSATSALNINGYDLTKINFCVLGTSTTLLSDQWVNGYIGIPQTNEFNITLPTAFDIINNSFSNKAPFGFCFHTYLSYQLGTGRYNININTNNNITSVTTIYDGYGFTEPITDMLSITVDESYAPDFRPLNTHFITRIDNSTSMTIFKL